MLNIDELNASKYLESDKPIDTQILNKIKSVIKVISGKSTLLEEASTLGNFEAIYPKSGPVRTVMFSSKFFLITINFSESIENAYIGYQPSYSVSLDSQDISNLGLEFVKSEFQETEVAGTAQVSKSFNYVYQVKDEPNISVIFDAVIENKLNPDGVPEDSINLENKTPSKFNTIFFRKSD